jgi:hypothetical protein
MALKFTAGPAVKKVVDLKTTEYPTMGIAVFNDGMEAFFSVGKHLEADQETPRFCTEDGTLKAGWAVEGEWLRDPATKASGISLASVKRLS